MLVFRICEIMVKKKITDKQIKKKSFISRPPIVTVMGHVDHGKTTLLDTIRKTNVHEKEAGGITQSIGAYQLKVKVKGLSVLSHRQASGEAGEKGKPEEKLITFIDTPGHEAFTAMRSRGAQITDIVVLVVAANDGVKPQTVEAIDHAKAAKVPIIVAVNKIDLPNTNIDKVKEQLTKYDLIAEDWGGQTIFVPISAKTGKNLEELLEMILLVAEMAELKSEENTLFSGVIIESYLDDKRGPVADIIVRSGTLRHGDEVQVAGIGGRIRGMFNSQGQKVQEAYPSMPVEVLGLNKVVPVGEKIVKRDGGDSTIIFPTVGEQKTQRKVSLSDLLAEKEIKVKEIKLIVKADSQGTLEAITQSLEKLSTETVKINIIHADTGGITESDLLLAKASQTYVLSFKLKSTVEMLNFARQENIYLQNFEVIYQLIEEVEKLQKGEIKPQRNEVVTGKAEVKAVFTGSKGQKIAGIKVNEGVLKKGKKARILRGEETVHEGRIKTIRHLKSNLDEIKKGMEGGFTLDGDFDYEIGDVIESIN